MSVINPNPLSNPKGVNLNCELCQKPAFVICKKCRVTYYCSYEHQKIDADGIHKAICDRLIILRAPTPFQPSHEEREVYRKDMLRQKLEVIDLTENEGRKLLFEREYERAVPAAMQCLKFCIDVYGQSSIEIVSPYLILGEASIGLGHLSQGHEYLSQAQWTVLKTPNCSRAIKSKLSRIVAMLYTAKGNYVEAARELADDIYYSSHEFGPDDINTSGGYFHLANVFMCQEKKEIAWNLYKQVSKIWYDYLKKIVDYHHRVPASSGYFTFSLPEEETPGEHQIDSARAAEGVQVLQAIYDLRDRYREEEITCYVIACFTLAMLYYVLREDKKCMEFATKAEYYLNADMPPLLSADVHGLMSHLRLSPTSPINAPMPTGTPLSMTATPVILSSM